MFWHHSIHKFTWISPDGKIDNIFVDRKCHLRVHDGQSFRRVDCDTDHYVMFAEVGVRLAVSKWATQKSDMEQFNLKKLITTESEEQYKANSFENLRWLCGSEYNFWNY
jgi:hypothetical protein